MSGNVDTCLAFLRATWTTESMHPEDISAKTELGIQKGSVCPCICDANPMRWQGRVRAGPLGLRGNKKSREQK